MKISAQGLAGTLSGYFGELPSARIDDDARNRGGWTGPDGRNLPFELPEDPFRQITPGHFLSVAELWVQMNPPDSNHLNSKTWETTTHRRPKVVSEAIRQLATNNDCVSALGYALQYLVLSASVQRGLDPREGDYYKERPGNVQVATHARALRVCDWVVAETRATQETFSDTESCEYTESAWKFASALDLIGTSLEFRNLIDSVVAQMVRNISFETQVNGDVNREQLESAISAAHPELIALANHPAFHEILLYAVDYVASHYALTHATNEGGGI